MKFMPTINLYNRGIIDMIYNGQLKIQPGQWVRCGDGPKARYAGTSRGGTLYVAHEQGSPAKNAKRFNDLRKALKR